MKAKNNIVTAGLSGKIGKIVFRQRFGETIVARAPKLSKQPSAAQSDIRQLFKKAIAYARAVMADAALKQTYRKKAKPGRTAFNRAIADYFKPPEIYTIDTSKFTGVAGGSIRIEALDDFRIQSVLVRIEKPDGTLVEDGIATDEMDGLHWLYTSSTALGNTSGLVVIVTATDMPGNSIVKQKTI